ncbi:MAG: aspartyl/glutamyl-tRNA amidotransferase subunit C [Patescibacteria group bacterium]
MLSKADIKHIANLSRINIESKEEGEFSRSISSVLDYVSRLKKADSGIEVGFADSAGNFDIFREDDIGVGLSESVCNLTIVAPETKNGYVKTKRVMQ